MAAKRRSAEVKDWLCTLVGLAGILVTLSKPSPNVLLFVASASLAGRPVYAGLADIVQIKRNDIKEGAPDEGRADNDRP